MIYTLKQKQLLPISIDEAWSFFSEPKNLEELTPKDIGFNIKHNHSPKLHEGQIISYTIGLAPFIKVNWVTEITHIVEKKSFIDDQRLGPYKLWHHQHHFEETPDGVMMHDLVHYALPFGVLGKIVHSLFVKAKLASIFEFRRQSIEQIFTNKNTPTG